MQTIELKMKELPANIRIVGENGTEKTYQVTPQGKLGACMIKAPVSEKK